LPPDKHHSSDVVYQRRGGVHGVMTLLSLAGVYCARTLLGRRVCKRVDVYMITLLCTWRIYALSERLLVWKWILRGRVDSV